MSAVPYSAGPTNDLPSFYSRIPEPVATVLAPLRRGLNAFDEKFRFGAVNDAEAVAELSNLERMMAAAEGPSAEKPAEFAPPSQRYALLRGRLATLEQCAAYPASYQASADPSNPANRDAFAHYEPMDHADILAYVRANPGMTYAAAEQFVKYGR